MTQYVDKESLVIKKILNEINRLKGELDGYSASEGLDYIEAYINTLQQSIPSTFEVDLNREIEKELETRWRGEYLYTTKFKESAKHFFELGLKAQKGE